ncbi:peptidylprolyl isomerase [Flavobacteriaceae bacterium]|nr:peptidylprolyl isomerase [Flavobacteriaceae bacterium]MDC1492442.1 peptidylprolyl isomerase [Flavobacteriaceae bacterium]
MRKTFLFYFIFPIFCFAQNNSKDILFSIDDNIVTSEEFLRVYNKNLDLITDQSQKDIDNYLQLYIDYKLKVLEAYEKQYDKNESYISELNKYSAQLASNYLYDKNSQDSLLNEAYQRTKKEINASHILIRVEEQNIDTLDIYNKLLSYREEFKNSNFEFLVKKYHDGKNIFVEDLGYFSAFKMIYSFESMAYQTNIGDVSMPFRTRFGFHILKVNDIRNSLGEVTVGHIMLFKKNKDSELKINSLYDSIINGYNFESLAKIHSNDKNTSSIGGKLKPFTSGQLNSLPFENAAFELQDIGQISKPIETKFGWHILKLHSKSELSSFNEIKSSLLRKVKNNSRSSIISNSFYNKLLDKYSISYENDLTYFINQLNGLDSSNPWVIPNNINKTKVLVSFNNVKLSYLDFANYIVDYGLNNQLNYKSIRDLYIDFINKSLMNYYKLNLLTENKEYRHIYNEYKDGLLLFDLMENEVWNKAKEDTIALEKYYYDNKLPISNNTKKMTPYKDIPGEVISKYQLLFENKWIKSLKDKREIFINKKVLKKVLKKIKKN